MAKKEIEIVKEIRIFKTEEGKAVAVLKYGETERRGEFPDLLLAMYWAEDFLYGEKGETKV